MNKHYLKIIDDGIGIPKCIIEKLQQPYQTFNQEGLNPKGTGLGLFNCYNICQIVGDNDKIKIQSEINKGSNFSF